MQVVDDTLENLRNGLELNDTKFNQKRLAVGKFIGELYNYRLIDSSVVFKVLYTLLTYGADANESGYIPLDQPEDMLRRGESLLDNAPNYVGSWLIYPKEISCNHNLYSYYFLHFFSIFSPLCITKLKAIVPCHIFCTNLKIITVL